MEDESWSCATTTSHSVLMLLLCIKQFGVDDAIRYAFKLEFNFPKEIRIALIEYCRSENIDVEK